MTNKRNCVVGKGKHKTKTSKSKDQDLNLKSDFDDGLYFGDSWGSC